MNYGLFRYFWRNSIKFSAEIEIMSRNSIVVVGLVFYFLFGNRLLLFGQSDVGDSLEGVTVTATRQTVRNINLPYSTYNLKQKDIKELMPRSVPEALTGIPGLFIQKTNHGGGSPFIRGLTGNQTLTLIDGIRLNNATFRYGPNQYLNTIDLFSLDRIEVVKGSGSVQYGSDAIGGVIQIFTKEPRLSDRPMLSGQVLGKYMTGNMEKSLRGELNYSDQRFAVLGGYSYKRFGDLWGGDTTGRQSPSGYEENAFDIKMKYMLPRNWMLKAAHQTLVQTDVPVYHKIRLENYAINKMDPQTRNLSYLNLEKISSNPLFARVLFTVSNQHTRETRIMQKNGSNAKKDEQDRVNTNGISVDISSRSGENWSANTGAEFYFDKINSFRKETEIPSQHAKLLRGLYPDDSKYASLSFYSLHHVRLENWILEAGARFNYFQVTVFDTTLGKIVTRPSALVANLGILRKIDELQSLYASYNRGFRAPNIDDMGTLGIVDFRYERPAYDLRPETSNNFELGYKLVANKVYANISLFYNQMNNLITRQKVEGQVIDGYPVYQKVNTDRAYIWGTDVEVGFNVIPHLDVTAVTSYAFGQNITRDEPLRRIPPMNKRVLVNYHFEKWYAKAEWLNAKKQDRLAKGDTEDNRIPAGGTPGWNVFNFYGGHYFNNMLVNAGLQNLFNQDYRTHGSGINGVGRSVWVSVQVGF
jgi:outer membrane receptor protein involved in Fe transport